MERAVITTETAHVYGQYLYLFWARISKNFRAEQEDIL